MTQLPSITKFKLFYSRLSDKGKGWLETLEILSNKNLTTSIQAGLKDVKKKNIVSQDKAEEFLGWVK